MTDRRQELADAATDYVLEHGLIGLTLRPLAAAIGTSDRMLLYHFRDKDDLLATVLTTSNERSVQGIRALAPSVDVRRAVLDLWATVNSPSQARCQRLYVEAAAVGVLGVEPYASVVARANEVWMEAVADHLRASGVPTRAARRAATLLDATFMGLQLDLQLEGEAEITQAVHDLAAAVTALWAVPAPV